MFPKARWDRSVRAAARTRGRGGFRLLGTAATLAVAGLVVAAPAAASTTLDLDGSISALVIKPDWTGSRCPTGGGDECGVVQFVGLGPADYVYVYGPTFAPNGTRGCFDIDGTFTITLRSDGSRVSGPLTGVFCGPGESAHQIGTPSYGGPRGEDDTIGFSGGTGRFAGLRGTAAFSQREAGAELMGTLTGRLSG
jgi:hypothetical protein